jgi:hypothetical protein
MREADVRNESEVVIERVVTGVRVTKPSRAALGVRAGRPDSLGLRSEGARWRSRGAPRLVACTWSIWEET